NPRPRKSPQADSDCIFSAPLRLHTSALIERQRATRHWSTPHSSRYSAQHHTPSASPARRGKLDSPPDLWLIPPENPPPGAQSCAHSRWLGPAPTTCPYTDARHRSRGCCSSPLVALPCDSRTTAV